MSDSEPITVPDAAVALAVNERRLRRLLERGEYAARTVTITRRTVTGTRTATALPQDLFRDIAVIIKREWKASTEEEANTSQTPMEGMPNPKENAANGDANGDRNAAERGGNPAANADNAAVDTVPFLLREIIDRQDREINHLREVLREAQTLHLGTMGELQRWQRQAAELEAMNAKLIEALPTRREPPASVESDQGDEAKCDKTGQNGTTSANPVPVEGLPAEVGNSANAGSDDIVIARIELPPHSEARQRQGSWWARLFGGGK